MDFEGGFMQKKKKDMGSPKIHTRPFSRHAAWLSRNRRGSKNASSLPEATFTRLVGYIARPPIPRQNTLFPCLWGQGAHPHIHDPVDVGVWRDKRRSIINHDQRCLDDPEMQRTMPKLLSSAHTPATNRSSLASCWMSINQPRMLDDHPGSLSCFLWNKYDLVLGYFCVTFGVVHPTGAALHLQA